MVLWVMSVMVSRVGWTRPLAGTCTPGADRPCLMSCGGQITQIEVVWKRNGQAATGLPKVGLQMSEPDGR